MGDFERTFGAGADAADIIDGYSNEFHREIAPAPFVPPEGMPNIEKALFETLSEYTREMESNYGLPPGDLVTDWTLIRIVALLPDCVDTMKAVVGTQIDNLHGFVEAVREAKEHKHQFYLKAREKSLSKYAGLRFDDSE